MKQFVIICCLLSLFIPSIEIATACDNEEENCKGVVSKRADSLKPDSIDLQREILAVLFRISKNDVDDKIKYTYNYYGDNCDYPLPRKEKCVYNGGHAGWDVRTRYEIEEDPLSENQLFYSLTKGIVILDGKKGENNTEGEKKFNTIAIYDADSQRTTFYIHASDVHPSIVKEKEVKINDPLGWQGDTGSEPAVHVHLEVQKGKSMRASGGTKDVGTQTIDPIPYLHESIKGPEIVKREPEAQRITLERGERERFEIEAQATDGVAIAYIEFSAEGQDSEKDSCRRNCMEHDTSVRYKWNTPREERYKVTAKIVDVDGATTETYWFVEVPHAPIEIKELSPAPNDFDDIQRINVNVNTRQKFHIKAESDDDIKSISFVVSDGETVQLRDKDTCRWFCGSESHSINYRFPVQGQYNVVATVESKTGKIVTREWIVSVGQNHEQDAAAPSLAKPQVTTLLANYPNPFNPETWIPYQLAEPADVSIAIYAADGTLVRTLRFGHQAAGIYQSRSRAAYWDGTNAQGEPMASGVYFYTFKAGEFTATRKMLIRK